MNTTQPPRATDLQSPSDASLPTTRLFSLAPTGGEARGEGEKRRAVRTRPNLRAPFGTVIEPARRLSSAALPLTPPSPPVGAREFAFGRRTVSRAHLALFFLSLFFCQLSRAAVPTDAEIRDAYHKSYRYEKAQNYADAIKALAPVVDAYPTAYTVNLRLGWLNYLTGGFATARKHYETAIKAAPDSIEAKLGHTLPLMAQEKWDDAAAVARQVLRIDPSNYTANLRLAYVLRLQKKFDAAEQILNGMLVLYPTDISLLTEFALIKLAKDNKPEAKRVFNDILTLDPENVTAKAQLSKL